MFKSLFHMYIATLKLYTSYSNLHIQIIINVRQTSLLLKSDTST